MTKFSVLSAVLMTSMLFHPAAKAGFLKKTKETAQSKNIQDVYSGLKFNYLDKDDRLLIVQDLFKTIELEYSLLPLKKERIGLDYDKLKADTIAYESAVENVLLDSKDRNNEDAKAKIAFLQASSNMEFMDRVIALVAKFQDTHFSIQEKVSRPFIYNGVRLFRVGGKIVVGMIEPKFLSMVGKLSGTDFSSLKMGDEVISIDGVPVEDKVAELKKYVSGSSDEFLDSQAVRGLTLRNYNYEKKNYMKIEFKNAGLFKFPIFVNNSMTPTPRADVVTYMNKYNIQSDATSIGIAFDPTTKKWDDSNLNFMGYIAKSFSNNIKGVTDYVSDTGASVVRTGYYISKGKTYGVLQLFTFSVATVKNGTTSLPFLDAIKNFILEVKGNEVPLILDLRSNNGGNGSYPAKVLSMLTEEGKIYAPSTTAMRMTQYIRQVQEQSYTQLVAAEDQSEGVTIDILRDIIEKTLDAHADYSPMIMYGVPTVADPSVKGFNNKVVALVSGDCISACDKMAFLLKSSKRSTIIGTHSNGTGAGFLSTETLDTKWGDRLNVFSSTLPNYVFGLPGEETNRLVYEDDSVSRLCTENRPTVADIQYATQLYDLGTANLGWLRKAAEVLDAK
jgi:hypothetical protein